MSKQLDSLQELCDMKGFFTLHLNIRSLTRKMDLLKLSLLRTDLDLICLTETWLKPDMESNLFSIEGYSFERHDRKIMNSSGAIKTGGGICMYIKDHLNYRIVPETTISNNDIESLGIRINFVRSLLIVVITVRSLLIVVIYRPPKGLISKFLDALHSTLAIADEFSHPQDIVFLGDMNIDMSSLTSSQDKAKLLQFCRTVGMDQLISVPTRFGSVKNSILDLIMSKVLHITCHGTVNLNLSDHLATFFIKKKYKNSYEKCKFYGRSYRDYSYAQFHKALLSCDWSEFYLTGNPEVAWSILFNHILTVANLLCPYRYFFIRKDAPVWFNRDIIEMAHHRDLLYKEYQKTKNPNKLKEARNIRNQVKSS